MNSDRIIDLDDSLVATGEELVELDQDLLAQREDAQAQREAMNELMRRVQNLANEWKAQIPDMQQLETQDVLDINLSLDRLLEENNLDTKAPLFPKLTTEDVIISSVAGLIATVLDVMFVGTPEIVKIWKGKDRFDGSILTAAIRNLADGPIGGFAEQLSQICKVPYDISIVKDGMMPNNHRLRSLAHDPFFGLFFAVFDITFGTTTFIDNSGSLRIIRSPSNNKNFTEKLLAVFFYIGHIISDLFTPRGIPIPGFFLTQFFTDGAPNESVAKIAQNMYLDGYDMRHLVSMNVPVMAKDIILTSYLRLMGHDTALIVEPIAAKETRLLNDELRKTKMMFIADSIALGGNMIKFFLPPSCCNPCSLNTAEWFAFLHSSIGMAYGACREMDTEQAMHHRREIDRRWDALLSDE